MKRIACAFLTTAALAAPAWADTGNEAASSWLRPFIGAGYSWGGHTLYPAQITVIGTSKVYDEDLSAGAGLDLRFGLLLQPVGFPLGIKAAVAHHVDGASGLNGWGAFRRNPLELGLSWSVNNKFALGAGARHSTRAKLRVHFDDYEFTDADDKKYTAPADQHEDYSAKTGFYVEAEWRPATNWGLQARFVRESFTLKQVRFESQGQSASMTFIGDGPKYNADQFGLELVYYFN
jgi:hypothetical protein